MKLRNAILAAAALLPLSLTMAPAGAQEEENAGGAVKTAEVTVEMFTDAKGMTLYTFDPDTEGVSTCYDDCAVAWPPLLAAEGAMADEEWTIVDRTDGTKQWAYDGKPLYYWYKDMAAGDTNGDGVGGIWHIARESLAGEE